jgi:membrane-associated protease RseP (regulator of RpoE activity)
VGATHSHFANICDIGNALLDIGAAGPLCGLAVALPVVIYGIATSPVEALPETGYIAEGHSIVYASILFALKGPIPEGYDVMLNPTALAGWAGLLITMINLLPFGQLDGGHIAYALLGPRQDRVSKYILRLLPVVALVISVAYGFPSYLDGVRGDPLVYDATAGMHWLVWAVVLWLLTRATGPGHPPPESVELTPKRRVIGWLTLFLFVLLFMPAWIRMQ